jgi:hypothetical protein
MHNGEEQLIVSSFQFIQSELATAHSPFQLAASFLVVLPHSFHKSHPKRARKIFFRVYGKNFYFIFFSAFPKLP